MRLHIVVLAERCMVKMVKSTLGGHSLLQDQLPGRPRCHDALTSGASHTGLGRQAEQAAVEQTH